MVNFQIAIDGPAGSGKSSISSLVAKKLNFVHIDTGAMYRAVTLEALNRKIDLEDENEYDFVEEIKVEYKNNKIYLNNKDVSVEIRTKEVTNNASTVAKFSKVRDKMVEFQRLSAKQGLVIMDGRDIGTVVLPNANLKVFLTASVEERAKRRYKEITMSGLNANYEDIKNDIILRDYKDSNREVSPLKKAEDAILIDTTMMTIDDVCNRIIFLVNERINKNE